MKCAYCEATAPKMMPILDFLGMDLKSEPNVGICEECQKLPKQELLKKADQSARNILQEGAAKIRKRRRPQNSN